MSDHQYMTSDSERDSFSDWVKDYQSISAPEKLKTGILKQVESVKDKKTISISIWIGAIAATLLVFVVADFRYVFQEQPRNELTMLPSIASASRFISEKPELSMPTLSALSGLPTLPSGELIRLSSTQNLHLQENRDEDSKNTSQIQRFL